MSWRRRSLGLPQRTRDRNSNNLAASAPCTISSPFNKTRRASGSTTLTNTCILNNSNMRRYVRLRRHTIATHSDFSCHRNSIRRNALEKLAALSATAQPDDSSAQTDLARLYKRCSGRPSAAVNGSEPAKVPMVSGPAASTRR